MSQEKGLENKFLWQQVALLKLQVNVLQKSFLSLYE